MGTQYGALASYVRLVPPAELTTTWYGSDDEVASRSPHSYEVLSYRGPEHCDWESVVFLSVLWPPGRKVKAGEDIDVMDTRQYVRDAKNMLGRRAKHRGELDLDVSMPRDAADTGYHTKGAALWFGPDDGDRFAYLVLDGRTERWPRDRIACM